MPTRDECFRKGFEIGCRVVRDGALGGGALNNYIVEYNDEHCRGYEAAIDVHLGAMTPQAIRAHKLGLVKLSTKELS